MTDRSLAIQLQKRSCQELERIQIASATDIEKACKKYGGDGLFRGQVKHYGALSTSFERQGCIPSEMSKWSHYASFSLASLIGRNPLESGIEFSQAILQHYGWRSFYLDASSDSAVASWFASNQFQQKTIVDMREDCFEDPVWLRRLMADYSSHSGEGHMYVLSKEKLSAASIACWDLDSIPLKRGRPRFHAQKAWLVGPLHGNLPLSCISAYLTGPASAFREHASAHRIEKTAHLFPSMDEDFVLQCLLTLPWIELALKDDSKISIPAFRRSIEFPEYSDDGYRKILAPYFGFYRPYTASAALKEKDALSFKQVPEWTIFGSADTASRFPNIVELLQKEKRIVFEIDNLVRMPETGPSVTYCKGLFVEAKDELVAISDFVVDHPGMQVHGAGMNYPWHYKINSDGTWVRANHPDDCKCVNDWRHQHHLSALTIIDDWLSETRPPV